MNIYAKFQLHSFFMASEMIFEYFFENLAFRLPWQPIKISNLDKIHVVCRGLRQKHFSKTFFSKYLQ